MFEFDCNDSDELISLFKLVEDDADADEDEVDDDVICFWF
jgi:hypothetical protein